jgi:hypothetical protein
LSALQWVSLELYHWSRSTNTIYCVPLFNPRQQKWSEHFIWSADGIKIIGITPTGRATCERLDLNDENHNQGWIQKARRFWVKGGWHPPNSDPRFLDLELGY